MKSLRFCLVNNKAVLRKDWNRKIKNNDNIVFMTVYRGGDDDGSLRTLLTIVVIVVATVYGGALGKKLGF